VKSVRFDRVVEQVIEDHRLAVQARRIRPDLRLNPFTLQADEEKLRAVVRIWCPTPSNTHPTRV